MNPWRWVDPRVDRVRVPDVQAYFERRGWTLEPNPNPNLLLFERPARGKRAGFPLLVPASEKLADFRQRIVELLTTLSELEDRHPVCVLDDVLQANGQDVCGERSESGGKVDGVAR
jgi:hypothetical protein